MSAFAANPRVSFFPCDQVLVREGLLKQYDIKDEESYRLKAENLWNDYDKLERNKPDMGHLERHIASASADEKVRVALYDDAKKAYFSFLKVFALDTALMNGVDPNQVGTELSPIIEVMGSLRATEVFLDLTNTGADPSHAYSILGSVIRRAMATCPVVHGNRIRVVPPATLEASRAGNIVERVDAERVKLGNDFTARVAARKQTLGATQTPP